MWNNPNQTTICIKVAMLTLKVANPFQYNQVKINAIKLLKKVRPDAIVNSFQENSLQDRNTVITKFWQVTNTGLTQSYIY
jgi:hypothetical protein